MKKTFFFNVPNKVPARQLDSIRHEVRKYIARERRKPVPEAVDYWGFDCKIGADAATAVVIHVGEISTKIDALVAAGKESFYLEILAKPKSRPDGSPGKKSEKK